MDYKVVFQETFLEDLESIVRKIAAENVAAAVKLGEQIVGQGESLVFFPERHPRVRQRRELRRYIVARHYKVFYRVRAEARIVEILRCWDGRQGVNPQIK